MKTDIPRWRTLLGRTAVLWAPPDGYSEHEKRWVALSGDEDDRVQRRALPPGTPRAASEVQRTHRRDRHRGGADGRHARRHGARRRPGLDRRRLGLRRHGPDDGLGTAVSRSSTAPSEARSRTSSEAARALVAEAFLSLRRLRERSLFPPPRFRPTARPCGASSRTRRSSAAWPTARADEATGWWSLDDAASAARAEATGSPLPRRARRAGARGGGDRARLVYARRYTRDEERRIRRGRAWQVRSRPRWLLGRA